MSGFFGIFNRNGKPVDTDIVNNMFDAMSYWNPDDSNVYINDSIALGHTMLWNTPESKFEHLPLEKEAYIITMDVRIDNRDELIKELELPNHSLEKIGDSEFILAAYKKWGEKCPEYLLGDFSFAIWDEKQQQLFCVRDHIGIKQFYFYLGDDLFVFGNDIEGILAQSNVSQTLNDNVVAAYLKDEGIHTKRDTFFENVKKLPPGTTLTVTSSEIVENEYWCIENSPLVHYDSFQEYVEKLKELFQSAVEVRLRTAFPISSHLSGGIDSSPIAVMAARKLKKKNKNLYVYNWIKIPSNKDEYEFESWSFSRRISKQETNIYHEEFSVDPKFMLWFSEKHNILTKGSLYSWEEYHVQDMVENIGARTILSGWGGDELISHNGYSYISGLFSQGKIINAFRCLFNEKKYLNYSWVKFFKRTLRMMLSKEVIKYLKNKNEDYQKKSHYYNQYSTKEFCDYMNNHHQKEYPDERGVKKNQLALYNYGHIHYRIESWALSAFSKRIEYRYPLLDKRIVEFAIGIPEELFYPREGKERSLIKEAVSDLLTHDILWSSKPHEIKRNKTLKKDYAQSMKIIRDKYYSKDCKFYKNKYVDCNKIKDRLETFDFENSDTVVLGNILSEIILMNSIKSIK